MNLHSTLTNTVTRFSAVFDDRFPDVDRRATLSALAELVRDGQLSQWNHESGMRYWTRRSSTPLSLRSLVRAYAVTMFCTDSRSRTLVTRQDIADYFPDLFRHGLPSGYYIERSNETIRLGHVRIDAGESKTKRIVAGTERVLHKRREESGFRQLIDAEQFEVSWIVPTHAKQRRLMEELQPLAASGVHLRVIAMPILLNIIAPINGQ